MGFISLSRGNPADPQIYLESTYLQDPGPEAHLVNRGSNIKRLKTASNCTVSSCCLSGHKLEAVINNATIADICQQLARKLKTASNCSKSSCCLSCRRPESAVSNTTIADICLQLSFKLHPTAASALIPFLGGGCNASIDHSCMRLDRKIKLRKVLPSKHFMIQQG